MTGLESALWLTCERPRCEQHSVCLDGTLTLCAQRERLGGFEPPFGHGPAGRHEPQIGGPPTVARTEGQVGCDLTGPTFEARMDRFKRRQKGRACRLPLLWKERRLHRVHGQRMPEAELATVGVDELGPGGLTEPVDRLLRRATERGGHHVPVELAARGQRHSEGTARWHRAAR